MHGYIVFQKCVRSNIISPLSPSFLTSLSFIQWIFFTLYEHLWSRMFFHLPWHFVLSCLPFKLSFTPVWNHYVCVIPSFCFQSPGWGPPHSSIKPSAGSFTSLLPHQRDYDRLEELYSNTFIRIFKLKETLWPHCVLPLCYVFACLDVRKHKEQLSTMHKI